MEKIHSGNGPEYDLENCAVMEHSPLKGKTILYLGSSVTYGAASQGVSFVEYISKRNGCAAVKEAVSGTTLADVEEGSYIRRMEQNLDPALKADAFICQLSTNDATRKLPLGEISAGSDLEQFDTQTVTGAIEYIIAYAKKTWDCPVFFYTGSYYESPEYEAMVERLCELQKKWGIGIIDMYKDQEFNAVSKEMYDAYMDDPIHPVKRGYLEWWTPFMEKYLYEHLA